MPKDKSFHDYVLYDLLGGEPSITSRAMFGGWALYKCGVIFGIIVNSELYCKVNKERHSKIAVLRTRPFTYRRRDGRSIAISYWLVPEKIIEDREKICDLINLCLAVDASGESEQ